MHILQLAREPAASGEWKRSDLATGFAETSRPILESVQEDAQLPICGRLDCHANRRAMRTVPLVIARRRRAQIEMLPRTSC